MNTMDLEQAATEKIRIMRGILIVGFLLTIGKFIAWFLTHSDAVLTDALESIINIIAAAIGLLSLTVAARPRDENHPYGHGKIEFLSVGFEGGAIFLAGAVMTVKAVYGFFHPLPLARIDIGLWITAGAAGVNGFMGWLLLQQGKRLHSQTLVADGKHLLSDTWSSVILLIGLGAIRLTGYAWIDPTLALLLGLYILVVGYRLLRDALAGLMDEADFYQIKDIIHVLNSQRRDQWIDIHNLRVVKYGSQLHIDAHLTLPWYQDLRKSHDAVKELEGIINERFRNRVEFFIHTDPCLPASCPICTVSDCPVRQEPFRERLDWNLRILLKNEPHRG